MKTSASIESLVLSTLSNQKPKSDINATPQSLKASIDTLQHSFETSAASTTTANGSISRKQAATSRRPSAIVGEKCGPKASLKYAKAIYDYTAQASDELSFDEDDIIGVLSLDTCDGWLFGECGGVWGFFPKSYADIQTPEQEDWDSSTIDGHGGKKDDDRTTSDDTNASKSWISKLFKKKIEHTSASPTIIGIIDTSPSPEDDENSPSVVAGGGELDASSASDKRSRRTSFTTGLFSQGKVPDKAPLSPGISIVAAPFSMKSMVSIVGAPAATKMRWIDMMGGNEEVAKLNLSKNEIQRQEVIYEVLITEKDFVEDLEIIIELYIKGFQRNKLLRPKDLTVIFSNVENLLPVNKSDYLKMYTMYCSNHPYALMKLLAVRQNKAVAKFLDHCATLPESRNLNLANFLLKPVQRICKYPLLVREIIKRTEPDHVDYENLTKALLKIETVVSIVNEGARKAESVHKMLDLQSKLSTKMTLISPTRSMLRNGPIDLLNANNEKKKRDMFLLAKHQNDNEKVKAIAVVPFDMILVNSITDTPGKENLFEIVHIGNSKFTLACESSSEKTKWLKALGDATDDWVRKGSGSVKIDAGNAAIEVEAAESTATLDSTNPVGAGINGEAVPDSKSFARPASYLRRLSAHFSDKVQHGDGISPNSSSDQLPRISSLRRRFGSLSSDSLALRPQSLDVSAKSVVVNAVAAASESQNGFKDKPALPPKSHSSLKQALSVEKPVILPKPTKLMTANLVHAISAATSKPASEKTTVSAVFEATIIINAETLIENTECLGRPSVGRLSTNPFIIQDVSSRPSTSNRSRNQSAAPSTARFMKSSSNLRMGTDNILNSNKASSSTGDSEWDNGLVNNPANGVKVCDDRQGAFAGKVKSDASFGSTSEAHDRVASDTYLNAGTRLKSNGLLKRPVSSASITGVTRHSVKASEYIYSISVLYIGGGLVETIIKHTYDDFFDFHMQILGHFPIEAGLAPLPNGQNSSRIIPDLPGQMMVVTEKLAQLRVPALQEYLHRILVLPAKIKKSSIVLSFLN